MAETARVGDLTKAKELSREDLAAAISTVFDGKTALPLPNGYELMSYAGDWVTAAVRRRDDLGSLGPRSRPGR